MKQVLLLTATIAPKPGTHLLSHADPQERLQDYLKALDFYLTELARDTFDQLVLVENSGHSVAALEALVNDRDLQDRVSFISFVSPLGPKNTRFYLELHMLAQAMTFAPLSRLEQDARMWKVSGRYIIRNIREIVTTAPRDADAYVNSRTRPVKWTEFFLAAFNRDAFQRILVDALDSFRLVESGEEVMWRRVNEEAPAGLRIVQRFRRVSRLEGVRGWDKRRYDDMRGKAGRAVRVVLNRVAPWWWI